MAATKARGVYLPLAPIWALQGWFSWVGFHLGTPVSPAYQPTICVPCHIDSPGPCASRQREDVILSGAQRSRGTCGCSCTCICFSVLRLFSLEPRVPHLRRVLVFAPKVGKRKPQPSSLNSPPPSVPHLCAFLLAHGWDSTNPTPSFLASPQVSAPHLEPWLEAAVRAGRRRM